MEKIELMKRYESETGESARDELYSGSMKVIHAYKRLYPLGSKPRPPPATGLRVVERKR